jgi:hypothetical protein
MARALFKVSRGRASIRMDHHMLIRALLDMLCAIMLVSTPSIFKYLSDLIFILILIIRLIKKLKYILKLYYIINYIFYNFIFLIR